jgi:hypothetical protein
MRLVLCCHGYIPTEYPFRPVWRAVFQIRSFYITLSHFCDYIIAYFGIKVNSQIAQSFKLIFVQVAQNHKFGSFARKGAAQESGSSLLEK